MRILAIETSCDETAIAVLETRKEKNGIVFAILSNEVSSQVRIHRPFGGVVPNLAKREHIKNLPILLKRALNEAKKKKFNAIAVTYGPGLEPALWTGINFAENLAKELKTPLIGVNHLEGHIYSAFMRGRKFTIPNSLFPILTLIVSGGHTELVLTKKHLEHKILGETLDDAVGEAFDKVARMLLLPYPGGPEISKIAKKGNPSAVTFPRPMINSKDLNFSFSGLKTAVLYTLRGNPSFFSRLTLSPGAPTRIQKTKDFPSASENSANEISRRGRAVPQYNLDILRDGAKEISVVEFSRADIAASFEQAAVDVLIKKTLDAVKMHKPKTVALGGGVAANDKLREELSRKLDTAGHKLLLPEKIFTGDNAAMIAVAAYFVANRMGIKLSKSPPPKAFGRLRL